MVGDARFHITTIQLIGDNDFTAGIDSYKIVDRICDCGTNPTPLSIQLDAAADAAAEAVADENERIGVASNAGAGVEVIAAAGPVEPPTAWIGVRANGIYGAPSFMVGEESPPSDHLVPDFEEEEEEG